MSGRVTAIIVVLSIKGDIGMRYRQFYRKTPSIKGRIFMDQVLNQIIFAMNGEHITKNGYFKKLPFYLCQTQPHERNDDHIVYAISKYEPKIYSRKPNIVGEGKLRIERKKSRLRVPNGKVNIFNEAREIYDKAKAHLKELIISDDIGFDVVTDNGEQFTSKQIATAAWTKRNKPIFATGYVCVDGENNRWGEILFNKADVLRACNKLLSVKRSRAARKKATEQDIEVIFELLMQLSKRATEQGFIQHSTNAVKITFDELFGYLVKAMKEKHGLHFTESFYNKIRSEYPDRFKGLNFIQLKRPEKQRYVLAKQFIDDTLKEINI